MIRIAGLNENNPKTENRTEPSRCNRPFGTCGAGESQTASRFLEVASLPCVAQVNVSQNCLSPDTYRKVLGEKAGFPVGCPSKPILGMRNLFVAFFSFWALFWGHPGQWFGPVLRRPLNEGPVVWTEVDLVESVTPKTSNKACDLTPSASQAGNPL